MDLRAGQHGSGRPCQFFEELTDALISALGAWHAGNNPFEELPAAAEHVWLWFLELDAARSGSGFGANPITFTELRAWIELSAVAVKPWELRSLRALDRERLIYLNRDTTGIGKNEPEELPPLTPEAVRGMFG